MARKSHSDAPRRFSHILGQVLLGALLAGSVFAALPERKTLATGDQISWDGTAYDFRAASGASQLKMWVPPGVKPVRGMIVCGHGGGTGDSRNNTRDKDLRMYAAHYGFAIVGLHTFGGGTMYEKGSKVFFGALDSFAAMGHHPEIAHLPFIIIGGSNGGATAYGLSCAAPDRAIAFVTNAISNGNPNPAPAEALKVPGMLFVGLFDGLVASRKSGFKVALTGADMGVATMKALVDSARAKGALWSWAAEEKGHEEGFHNAVARRFFETCIRLRLPADADASKGPVKLNDLKIEDGWLVSHEDWKSGFTTVAPFAKYKGDPKKAGWVPDEATALLYRAVATYDRPISLRSEITLSKLNTDNNPATRLNGGGVVMLEAGSKVKFICQAADFAGCSRLELWDGSEKLASFNGAGPGEYTITIDPARTVYTLFAVGYRSSDNAWRTSVPLYFYVNSPKLAILSDAEKSFPAYKAVKPQGSQKAKPGAAVATPTDSVLTAYGLSAADEQAFNTNDKKVSPFWSRIDDNHDYLYLDPVLNASGGSQFAAVMNNDARLTVKSAYGSNGLYLYMEVTDNAFVPVENKEYYIEYDATDFLIDSRSSKEISAADTTKTFMWLDCAITLTMRQFQCAFGSADKLGAFRMNYTDPWDLNSDFVGFADAATRRGIQIDFAVKDKFTRVQEWFIPWGQIGTGLAGEPLPGTRIGFSPGYNDTDPGEYLPGRSDHLRWIGANGPWGNSGRRGAAPKGWGDIEFGPLLAAAAKSK